MISLLIDTSLENVSISIIKDDKILSLIQKNIPNMHSIYTTSFIKDALEDSKINPTDIDNLMVVNGPGSFTGIRIGVTIAKTYGYLINKFITPISSLKALALSSTYKGTIMSIINANRNNYYVGIYDENYNVISKEEFANKDKLFELINKYHPHIVSNTQQIINDCEVECVLLEPVKIVKYYQDKEKINYHKLVPNYLKLPQAVEDKK